MENIIFVSGIGTGIGKTFMSSLLVNALKAHYWKPIQAGTSSRDIDFLQQHHFYDGVLYPETYVLQSAESPHRAAQKENIVIDIDKIKKDFIAIKKEMKKDDVLIIEGAGGLLSPVNDEEQNLHLIQQLNVPVLLVSQNYLGSINHSLLSSSALQTHKIKCIGWAFNGDVAGYEDDIVRWSGLQKLFSVPFMQTYPSPQNEIFEHILLRMKKVQ